MDIKALQDVPPWEWPEGVDQLLLETVQNPAASASDRVIAAEMAGDFAVIDDALAAALVSIVRSDDETDELRATAAIALGPALEYADSEGFVDPEEVPISEETFEQLCESLRTLFVDGRVPKEVRRRILEASVRAPQDWHPGAIRAAYASDDEEWKLSAVFCMRFVRGFDDQILEALKSEDPEIQYEAVCAAGEWDVDAAWPHVAKLVSAADTDKALLLAAIEAVAFIRPHEAEEVLGDLLDSDDEEVVEAVQDALAMAGHLDDDEDDDPDDDDDEDDDPDDDDDEGDDEEDE